MSKQRRRMHSQIVYNIIRLRQNSQLFKTQRNALIFMNCAFLLESQLQLQGKKHTKLVTTTASVLRTVLFLAEILVLLFIFWGLFEYMGSVICSKCLNCLKFSLAFAVFNCDKRLPLLVFSSVIWGLLAHLGSGFFKIFTT